MNCVRVLKYKLKRCDKDQQIGGHFITVLIRKFILNAYEQHAFQVYTVWIVLINLISKRKLKDKNVKNKTDECHYIHKQIPQIPPENCVRFRKFPKQLWITVRCAAKIMDPTMTGKTIFTVACQIKKDYENNISYEHEGH